MAGKLIKIENEYYLTTDTKVEEGDYGLAFAHGGRNGFGRGWYIFYHDGKPVNKLNAICAGTRKITHSTAPIDGDEVGSCFHIIEKLSLKNCEELFGVFDVEKLAEESSELQSLFNDLACYETGFIRGFNKAMELNKDKVFTAEDAILIAEYVRVASQSTPNTRTKDLFNEYQSLQQPTEIDVEIVTLMDCHNDKTYLSTDEEAKLCTNTGITALDSEGNLILKKI